MPFSTPPANPCTLHANGVRLLLYFLPSYYSCATSFKTTDDNASPSQSPPGMKHRNLNAASAAAAAAASPALPHRATAATILPAAPTGTATAAATATSLLSLLDVSVLVASGGWLDLASGKHLQEASGTLCRDCREYVGSHLRVDYSTPRVLWPLRAADGILFGRGGGGRTVGGGGGGRRGKENAGGGRGGGVGGGWGGSADSGSCGGKGGWMISQQDGFGYRKGRSIPPLRVTMMTWERPLSDLAHGRALPPGLQSLYFACSFRYFDIDWVSFPPSLLSLSFGQNFDQTIDSIAWPPCLQTLTFGWEFNQSVDGVQWPSGLKMLTFGQSFDQPIESVSWPLGLEDLTFGGRFHQPIHRVAFPPGLRRLTFGWRFNHPITEVVWPSGLQRLMFGSLFNQVRLCVGATAVGVTIAALPFSDMLVDELWCVGLFVGVATVSYLCNLAKCKSIAVLNR